MTGPKIIMWVLGTGTRNVFVQLGRWHGGVGLEGSQRAGGVILRFVGSLLILWFAGGVLWAVGVLQYAALMTWFVTACIFGGDAEDVLGDDPEEVEPELPVVEALHALLGDRNGVHLSQVAEHLSVDQRAVRGFLDEHGIRVRQSLKIDGLNLTGVHRDDMPPLPSPTLGEGAGRAVEVHVSGSTSTQTYEIRQTPEGLQAWLQDPFNPVRTHIVNLNKEAS
jgi:hypothetical protein